MSELHSIFSIDADPCNRSDTVFDDAGTFVNTAEVACRIASSIWLAGNNQDGMVLVVPATMTGQLVETGQGLSVQFPDPDKAMQLLLPDAGAVKPLPLVIERVDTDTNGIYARMRNSKGEQRCLKITRT